MFKSPVYCEEREKDIIPSGTRSNPPTGTGQSNLCQVFIPCWTGFLQLTGWMAYAGTVGTFYNPDTRESFQKIVCDIDDIRLEGRAHVTVI